MVQHYISIISSYSLPLYVRSAVLSIQQNRVPSQPLQLILLLHNPAGNSIKLKLIQLNEISN